MENKDLFAPPTKEELDMFSAPTAEELKSFGIEQPKTTIESIGEAASDVGRGVLSGLTMGGLEEITAAGKAAFDPEKEDFSTLYKKYLEIEEQKEKAVRERSPYLMGTGELVGSLIPAFVSGGTTLAASGGRAAATLAAKEAAEMTGKKLLGAAAKGALVSGTTGATLGGIAGGLGSTEGGLIGATEEERQRLLKDVASGAVTGGALGSILGVASPLMAKGKDVIVEKLKKPLDESVLGKQVQEAFQSGRAGMGYSSIPEQSIKTTEISQGVNDVTDFLMNIRKKAGDLITQPIDYASRVGKTISVDVPDSVVERLKESGAGDELLSIVNTLREKSINPLTLTEVNELSPSKAYTLRKALKSAVAGEPKLYNTVKSITDTIDQKIEDIFIKDPNFRKELENIGMIPSFKEGLNNYTNIMGLIESLTQKGLPPEMRDKFISDIQPSSQNKKIYESVESLIENLRKPGDVSSEAIRTMDDPRGGFKSTFEKIKNDPQTSKQFEKISKELGFENTEDLKSRLVSDIENLAIKSSTKRAISGERPFSSGIPQPKDILSLGRQSVLGTSYLAGKTASAFKKLTPVGISTKIYNLPETGLKGIADHLIENPKYEKYGKNLSDAIASGNTIKKQATLFALMQNPEFRDMLAPSFLTEGDENE